MEALKSPMNALPSSNVHGSHCIYRRGIGNHECAVCFRKGRTKRNGILKAIGCDQKDILTEFPR